MDFNFHAQFPVGSISISSDGRLVASATQSDLILWDLNAGRPAMKLEGDRIKRVCRLIISALLCVTNIFVPDQEHCVPARVDVLKWMLGILIRGP